MVKHSSLVPVKKKGGEKKGTKKIRLTDKDGCELKPPEFRYRVKRTINENLDNTIPETIIMRALTTEDNKLLLSEDGKILIY